MKADLFKKLIKQCVKEAMREELPLVLLEYQQRSTKSTPIITEEMKPLFQSNPEEIREVRSTMKNKMSELFGLPEPQQLTTTNNVENENPYLTFIADSAKNLTPQELAGLKNYG
jgi:hypothetical protein